MPAAPNQDLDEQFIRRRALARKEERENLEKGTVTPEELQERNSIIPKDFWCDARIDWEAIFQWKDRQTTDRN